MSHLLHLDASIQGARSVSRELSGRAVAAWRAANPGGTVTYRDLTAPAIPHLGADVLAAGPLLPEERTPEQTAAWDTAEKIVGEVRDADTIVLGLPLYNFGAPSTVKAWVDHVVLLGVEPETHAPLLGGRDLLVTASRGGGYAPGTPREGWDHAEQWLPHGLSLTGLVPRFITAELTLAAVTPAMEGLLGLAAESLDAARRAVDAAFDRPVQAQAA